MEKNEKEVHIPQIIGIIYIYVCVFVKMYIHMYEIYKLSCILHLLNIPREIEIE